MILQTIFRGIVDSFLMSYLFKRSLFVADFDGGDDWDHGDRNAGHWPANRNGPFRVDVDPVVGEFTVADGAHDKHHLKKIMNTYEY